MAKLNEIYKKHKFFLSILLFIIILTLAGVYIYRLMTYTYITIQFDDLRPFKEKLEVYYNGFEIGRAQKIMPSKDYKTTLVKIVLYPTDLKLPYNITAKLKREKRRREKVDFIELIYPEKPSDFFLKDGDIISGKSTVDIESYFASQEHETLDEIRDSLGDTISNLQITTKELGQLFATLQTIVQENRPNIKATTTSLAKASNNIEQITSKLNNSLNSNKLDNTTSNVDYSSTNIKETTQNLQVISENIDTLTKSINGTMPEINSIISNTGCIMKNINEITCGISKTLKKRMGGMRILFGQTIDQDCSCNCK